MESAQNQQQQQQHPAAAILYFTALWITINAVFRIHRRLAKAPADGTATGTNAADQQPGERLVEAELVSALHVKITTSALSRPVAWIAQSSWVAQRRVCGGHGLLDAFYALGVYITVVLMLLSLAVLGKAGVQIAQLLAAKLSAPADSLPAATAAVAGLQPASRLAATTATMRNSQLLRPVIPGITLPSAHLAYYVASLAACALIHELGHALAAALAHVRIRKLGVFLMGVYPGAFVDLQRDHLDRCTLGAQLRVACAGVWHNALSAALAWLVVYGGLLRPAFVLLGWMPVTDGVAVVEVSETSPLFGTLRMGSIVYRIDDVFLDGDSGAFGALPLHRWTGVLTTTTHNRETASMGFCAHVDENVDDGLCCEMSARYPLGESPDSQIFCFSKYGQQQQQRHDSSMCFVLRDVLQRTGALRCKADGDCPGRRHVCVEPRSAYVDGRVARVYSRDRAMAIYAGSLESLWLDVQVSTLRAPLSSAAPILARLPAWCEAMAQYTLAFSVAFALLNAIPAWYLDGDHVLRLLLLLILASSKDSSDAASDASDSDDTANESADDGAGIPSESASSRSLNESHQTQIRAGDGCPELSCAGRRIYTATTALATALLAWCVVGSVVALVL
ncbi:hypothetical protein GGI23_003595 [Coemansia sp. RSA 2559]|nr:hypothetical protein GGI23_003595 [Coemansia sp. RSA 2559]KAJ2862167.1 hypothetical protein GGI22_002263 [Coemansia erecta]